MPRQIVKLLQLCSICFLFLIYNLFRYFLSRVALVLRSDLFCNLLFSFFFFPANTKRSQCTDESSGEADRAITRTKVCALPVPSNKIHIIARVRLNVRNNIIRPQRYDPVAHIYFISIYLQQRDVARIENVFAYDASTSPFRA